MTITLQGVKKAAVLQWHQFTQDEEADVSSWTIKGAEASISVVLADGTEQEKRVVTNDGEANLFFPMDYTGSVTVKIAGSHSGEDQATLQIP